MKKQRVQQQSRFPITTRPLQTFDLETEEQIEQRFNEFLNEAQNETIKLVTVQKGKQRRLALNKNKKKTIKESQMVEQSSYDGENQSREDEIIELETKPQKKISQKHEEFYKFFVDRYFHKQEVKQSASTQTLTNDVNFLVNRYGDFLQNSLMSSLIIDTLKHKFQNQVPMYDHFGTAQKILQSFNVSAVTLCNMKTPEERQTYLLNSFQQKCDSLMNEWILKIAKKDKQLQQIDKQFTLTRMKNRKEQNDLFKWLTLKSKYLVLQKKLREMLMEKINEYENQIKIAEAISQNKKVNLTGIETIQTSQIVKNNNFYSQSNTDLLQWNPLLEAKFQKERMKAQYTYNSAINSSNFNQVAFMQIFDQVKIEDPVYLQREVKMQKYMNGDWLTPQEMKFLANTSELLNKCVDQKQVKKVVMHIKEKQLYDLENYLAQQIIQNHQSLNCQIQQARSIWLKEHTKKRKQQIKSHDQQIQEQIKHAKTLKEHDKKVKKLQRICKKLEENISIKDQVYRNFFALIFVRKVIQKVEYLRFIKMEKSNMFVKETLAEQEQLRLHKERLKELSIPYNHEEDKRRKYHPSSKVGFVPTHGMTADDWESLEGQKLAERVKILKQKENQYRLGVLSIQNNKKENFMKFYSSGPNKAFRQDPIFDPLNPNDPPKLSDKELNQIIMIQRAIRKRIAFKKLKNYKELLFQNKLRIYHEKLFKLNSEKEFQSNVKETTLQLISKPQLRIKTSSSRIKSEISLSKSMRTKLKTEETAEPSSIGFGRQGRLVTTQNLSKVKQLLVKHERLLRYSKSNQPNHILKSGFYYTQDDIDVMDQDGNTALYYACMHGNNILIDFMLKHGANPNVLCSDGTPMHMAVKSNKIDVIYLLLNNGGSLNIVNQHNCTPLVYATDKILKQLGMKSKGVVSVSKQFTEIKNDEILYSKDFAVQCD
ncbi:unnamed protein product [Paramecium octaurelia]|uniref:IQ calmodulin-binding motif family protein n=1 Tax=Paramecium octaurelia TaxID=43137 RepID=A0A8S1U739_PAROT|nr:unnamed protein product [Paramecium octaurelia]